MDFYVVADEDTVVGFRYAGVPGTIVHTAGQAADELDRMVEQKSKIIIITTEQIGNTVREKINGIRSAAAFPLIVEIPGLQGPSPDSPSLLKMIHEAIGIKV
jgi:V/A-type H+-transporting ATPase subunit F